MPRREKPDAMCQAGRRVSAGQLLPDPTPLRRSGPRRLGRVGRGWRERKAVRTSAAAARAALSVCWTIWTTTSAAVLNAFGGMFDRLSTANIVSANTRSRPAAVL